jgi:hypothetical protein
MVKVTINGDGHYQRNLALRVLRDAAPPDACVLVFLWARREFGDFAGVMAAALCSTLPTVLAFSSMAYTDLVAACMQFGAMFAFATWLRKPSARSTIHAGGSGWSGSALEDDESVVLSRCRRCHLALQVDSLGMPEFTVPEPFQPVTGWVAVSKRPTLTGDIFHKTYPSGAFAWLDKYQPVEQVGKTIILYYIPADAGAK